MGTSKHDAKLGLIGEEVVSFVRYMVLIICSYRGVVSEWQMKKKASSADDTVVVRDRIHPRLFGSFPRIESRGFAHLVAGGRTKWVPGKNNAWRFRAVSVLT